MKYADVTLLPPVWVEFDFDGEKATLKHVWMKNLNAKVDLLPQLPDNEKGYFIEDIEKELKGQEPQSDIYELELNEALELEMGYTATPGSSSYFSSQFGNYLPGDPPEFDIYSLKLGNIELESVLSPEQEEELAEQISEDEGY